MKPDRAVTVAAFAKAEHLTPRHVRRLIEDGLPTVKTPRGPKIRPAAGHAWIDAARRARIEAPSLTDARRGAMLERARKLRLENDTREGQLAPVAEYKRRETARVVRAKNQLLALPSRVKQRLPHIASEDLIVLDELVRKTLEELAREEES
jgi:phage terminase Nu1 subunit (DNA packaging protein)